MQHVFIIGSKGIPARYGGFETFVEMLTKNRVDSSIKYHVACATDESLDQEEAEYNGAHCFYIKRRPLGSARAVLYDVEALRWSIDYVRRNNIAHPIFYVLACRIGPFIGLLLKSIRRLEGVLVVNPDGHEWKRAKWSAPIRAYWKFSELGMVRAADLLICDSRQIAAYVKTRYTKYVPVTRYIAYGADLSDSMIPDDAPLFRGWLDEHAIAPGRFFLIVGRFVPENNFEIMIREFMLSHTDMDLVVITDFRSPFYAQLVRKTGLDQDSRIKFVGTVYDHDLLRKIRASAFAYIHGHEVGGTNPSLLEALSLTSLSLLLDVGFNREVAGDSALYWKKDDRSLSRMIDAAGELTARDIEEFRGKARHVIATRYSWPKIITEYEECFSALAGGES